MLRHLLPLVLLATPLSAQEVARVGVDWVGNDIIVEALPDPEVEGVTGGYFANSTPRSSSTASRDAATAARLWDVSASLVGLTPSDPA